MSKHLRLGTRASELAVFQAEQAKALIEQADPNLRVELVKLVSEGDRDPRELRDIGERGIFAAHLERELIAGNIDAAVHSSKDLTLDPPGDLKLVAWLEREDPRDALVGGSAEAIGELEANAVISTGSSRRTAQLSYLRRDLVCFPIRGNIRTRLERSKVRGDYACMLALAGLKRLGIDQERDDIFPLSVSEIVPEAGQGAIVVQAPASVCARTGFTWHTIDHVETRRAVELERAIAYELDGGCSTPIGVHVDVAQGKLLLFVAAEGSSAKQLQLDLVGLELAPLLSVNSPADIADAVQWTSKKLLTQIAKELQV